MYNKQSISSIDSNKEISSNDFNTKSREKLNIQFNKIDEVDESLSEIDGTEKTMKMSDVPNKVKHKRRVPGNNTISFPNLFWTKFQDNKFLII